MKKAFECFDKAVKLLVVCIIIVMTSVECLQILGRYVFKTPFSWPEELVRYLFIWVTYMTIGMAIDKNRFATFDLLIRKVPKKYTKLYQTALLLIAIVLFGMLMVVGLTVTENNISIRSSAMRLPFCYVVAGVPIGAAVAIIYAVKNIIGIWTEKFQETGKEELL